MTIKNSSTSEHYQWGNKCDGWRLLDRPDLNVTQERVPPGSGETRHSHRLARQLFFVLAGELRIELQGETFVLLPGDSLEIPPGVPHRVDNTAAADAAFLVVSAPSTRGDRTNLE